MTIQTTPFEDRLYSVTQIRLIESAAHAASVPHALMQRAGRAAAQLAGWLLTGAVGTAEAAIVSTGIGVPLRPGARILIAAGPGNNGGDAFECAAHLAAAGYAVTVLVPPPPGQSGQSGQSGMDHAAALARAQDCAINFVGVEACAVVVSQTWALVIDGLFGIGLARPIDSIWQRVVNTLNAVNAPLLALDIPSGLDADTGVAGGVCIRATHTLTFIGNKPGLHTANGRDCAGTVTVAALDIAAELYPAPHAMLNRPWYFTAAQPRRTHNSHKGSFGDVQIIGGAAGMAGAAILAAHAALKAGSGRTIIGFIDPASVPQVIAGHPELMCRLAATLDFSGATLVVGPGLGTSDAAQALVARACATNSPLVLDADGLNLVAAAPALQAAVIARAERSAGAASTLLTPHPLEAARLLGISATAVQANRLHAAATLADRFKATVILKGSGTVIVHAGRQMINPTGNPALATGGTGDVLAGLCGALLAQRWAPAEAAAAAVWIHGAAADALVANGTGPIGVTASEVIDAVRTVLNQLVTGSFRPDGQP